MDLFDIDKVLDELEAAESMPRESSVISSKLEKSAVQESSATETANKTVPPLISLSEQPSLDAFEKISASEASQNLFEAKFDEDQPCSSHSVDQLMPLAPKKLTVKDEQITVQNEIITSQLGVTSSEIIASFDDSNFFDGDMADKTLSSCLWDLDQVVPLYQHILEPKNNFDNNEITGFQAVDQQNIVGEGNVIVSQAVAPCDLSKNVDFHKTSKDALATSEPQNQHSPTNKNSEELENALMPDSLNFHRKTFTQFKVVEQAGEALEIDELRTEENFTFDAPASVIAVIDGPDSSDKPLIEKPTRQLVTVASVDEEFLSWKPTESELQLGEVQPVWIPDQDSLICMLCEAAFSLMKRRHHCRACGRVLCAYCCHLKVKLPYMDMKESRVCHSCSERLQKIAEYQSRNADPIRVVNPASLFPPSIGTVPMDPTDSSQQICDSQCIGQQPAASTDSRPGVCEKSAKNLDHGSSDQIGLSQNSFNRAVPQSVLRQGLSRRESKSVMFCDGIKPGAEQLVDGDITTSKTFRKTTSSDMSPKQRELESFVTNTGRYLISSTVITDDWVTWEDVKKLLIDAEQQAPFVKFTLKRNLHVVCSVLKTSIGGIQPPPGGKICTFASAGLRNVCADELFVALTCNFCENQQPNGGPVFRIIVDDMLRFFDKLYENTLEGKPLADMSYGLLDIPAGSNFLGSNENAGFLYFRPTDQSLNSLHLPEEPFLIGLLFKTEELPWARVLPLRLFLRLGAEFNTYPWPVVSDPNRKPSLVCGGHTIMNILNDFRNFTYSIAQLTRSSVTLEANNLEISIPMDQRDQVRKIVQSSNDNVLAFACSFCRAADSHLVCTQNDAGSYVSQTIGKNNSLRKKVTGSSFVIFNASLKTPGPKMRVSIVEDGFMVQIKHEMMEFLRSKLLANENVVLSENSADQITYSDEITENFCDTKSFELESEKIYRSPSVLIKWERLQRTDLKIYSPVDGLWLGDSVRFRLSGRNMEISSANHLIRLLSIFALPLLDHKEAAANWEPPDDFFLIIQRITIGIATCILSKIDFLSISCLQTVGIRFAWGLDTVEYSVGFDGKSVPEGLVPTIDDHLVPILGSIGQDAPQCNPAKIELMLRVLRI